MFWRIGLFCVIFFSSLEITFSQQTVPKEVFSPVGVATIEERIKLETEFEKFLENQNILGIRALEKVPNAFRDIKDDQYQVFSASGFFIEKKVIATVTHVVKNKKMNEVLFENKWKKIELLGKVQTKDTAFFNFEKNQSESTFKYKSAYGLIMLLSSYQNVPLAKTLVGVKCVAGDEFRVVIGELVGMETATGLFAISIASNAEGCSGAPVFTFDGSIIGIIQSGFPVGVRAYALDISIVLGALQVFQASKESNK